MALGLLKVMLIQAELEGGTLVQALSGPVSPSVALKQSPEEAEHDPPALGSATFWVLAFRRETRMSLTTTNTKTHNYIQRHVHVHTYTHTHTQHNTVK